MSTIQHEIRYAERLCQRTARLYRHLDAAFTFISVLGASATLSALSTTVPTGLPITGAVLLAVTGALAIAVRPADKAAAADADGKRYSQLRARSASMTEDHLRQEVDALREGDTPEFEALRTVAYNDVVTEIGCEGHAKKLNPVQWVFGVIA